MKRPSMGREGMDDRNAICWQKRTVATATTGVHLLTMDKIVSEH